MTQIKKTFFNDLLMRISYFRIKRCLLKTRCIVLLTSLSFISDAYASQSGDITENFLFDNLHPNLQRPHRQTPKNDQDQQEVEFQQAFKVIDGVISMYREDVNFGRDIRYSVEIGDLTTKLNASYTHATRTFEFPRVLRNFREVVLTALDQGIVSHEAGHMILHYLRVLAGTPHTGAFHEAFGDLTSHFYKFYNPKTRQRFLTDLNWGQGCVGDTNFTCVRNNYQTLTLGSVGKNKALCEVHDFSRTFSSAVYRSMVSAFATRGRNSIDEYIAKKVVKWHKHTLVKAVLSLNYSNPTLMDIADKMLTVSLSQPRYRDELGQSFKNNGLILYIHRSPTPYDPYPTIEYYPNKKFAKLCFSEE